MPIEIKNLSYTYMIGTPFEHRALNDVSINIADGSFTALAGHTGSGKSTLIQHLNAMLQPTSGTVQIDGVNLAAKGEEAVKARQKVGVVFQYPEAQLFEETVEKDIAFGPVNQNLSPTEVTERVKTAMEFVGLDYESYRERSPFQLSGGQKRRVAIAGIMALRPKYLVLDEPTAGLDPKGRDELLANILRYHKQEKTTIIFVSHNMDDIARIADRVIVLQQGQVSIDDVPAVAFGQTEKLAAAGLAAPEIVTLQNELKLAGLPLTDPALTVEKAVAAIAKAVQKTAAANKTGRKNRKC